MQEWLKDKKNLPIVIAAAVVLMIVAGGVIGLELGLFSGSSAAQTTASVPPPGSMPPSGMPPGGAPPGGTPPGGMSRPGIMPAAMPRGPAGPPMPGMPHGVPGTPAAVAAAVKKPANTNPTVGPDPFQIPNGPKIASQRNAQLAGVKLPLRQTIGPLNLFQLHPPVTQPLPPIIPDGGTGTQPTPSSPELASRYRLSGIINGPDGINAIMEVDGQSQSAKPGDSLSDGTRVTNIQATSVTLRTPGGSVLDLPISAGTPDQGTPNTNNQPPPFQPGFTPQGQG